MTNDNTNDVVFYTIRYANEFAQNDVLGENQMGINKKSKKEVEDFLFNHKKQLSKSFRKNFAIGGEINPRKRYTESELKSMGYSKIQKTNQKMYEIFFKDKHGNILEFRTIPIIGINATGEEDRYALKKYEHGGGVEDDEIRKLDEAIKYFEDKIKEQGMITNARDEEHLVKLKEYKKEILKSKYEHGGEVNENAHMVMNQNHQIKHHTEELGNIVTENTHVPAWVVAKIADAANDLSDATHYLDGENDENLRYEKGGAVSAHLDELYKKHNNNVDAAMQEYAGELGIYSIYFGHKVDPNKKANWKRGYDYLNKKHRAKSVGMKADGGSVGMSHILPYTEFITRTQGEIDLTKSREEVGLQMANNYKQQFNKKLTEKVKDYFVRDAGAYHRVRDVLEKIKTDDFEDVLKVFKQLYPIASNDWKSALKTGLVITAGKREGNYNNTPHIYNDEWATEIREKGINFVNPTIDKILTTNFK
jgi:hypothetical protein